MRNNFTGCVLLCGLSALTAPADGPAPEPQADVLKALKGGWMATKQFVLKREMKMPEGMSFTFDGDKCIRTLPPSKAKVKPKGDGKLTYKVKLDTSKRPYKLTLTPDAGGRPQKWIVKIEKGELFLATTRAAEFPSDFGGEDVMLVMVLKRVPEKEKIKE